MKLVLVATLLLLVSNPVWSADLCGSFRDPDGRSSIDFAPLNDFVDVCSRDVALCALLSKGYPPSVQTIGYFVLPEEWQRYQKEHLGFSRYLIAQKGKTLSTDEFAGLKDYIRSQQGRIEDHTKLVDTFNLRGQAFLGVIDEGDDFISSGTVLAMSEPAAKQEHLLAAINIALQLKGESLSLYIYDTVKDVDDTERIKGIAKQWLQCIRSRNLSK